MKIFLQQGCGSWSHQVSVNKSFATPSMPPKQLLSKAKKVEADTDDRRSGAPDPRLNWRELSGVIEIDSNFYEIDSKK